MRRSALLGTLLLLSGCSGLGHFFQDTVRIPGQNPNATTGVSENLLRSRGQSPAEDAILPQNGNVWPGPPQPLPSLSDVSRNGGQNAGDLLGGTGGGTMPRGGSMSLGEQSQIHGGAPTNESGFSGGSLSESVPDPAAKFRAQHPQTPSGSNAGGAGGSGGGAGGGGTGGSTGAGSDIVIPNGDGTSTVISPDGTVKTVKGTPK